MSRVITLTGKVTDKAGNVTTKSTNLTVPTQIGVDAPVGQPNRDAIALWSNNFKYTRDFGKDTADADTLPELTPLGTGKFADLPAGAIMHVSWKDDVEELSTWLNGLNQYVYLTWYHEPMGDVVPATYRATAVRIPQIVNAHPKKNFVLGNGPIVTRYWLDEGGGNPTDWGYTGMTFYGVDCYQSTPTASAYFDNTKMFATVFNKVQAAYPGIKLMVPEYGVQRINSDTDGSGRAAAIRTHGTYLKNRPDVLAVAYYNNEAQFPQYAISPYPLETQAWKDVMATA